MTYRIADAALDAASAYIQSHTTRHVLLSADPTNFAGVAAVTLAAVAAAASGADFTLGATAGGVTQGRMFTVAAKQVTPSASGTATYLALVDDTNSNLLFLVPMASLVLTSGAAVTLQSWTHTFNPPTAN